MIYSKDCFEKYGNPNKQNNMVLWDVPAELELNMLPNKLYCNKDIVGPLTQAFKNIIERNLLDQIITWDGCFCIRLIRGSKSVYSLHSWGIAVDINASTNPIGVRGDMSDELAQCFIDAGFTWGRTFKRQDSQHFQLAKI